MPGAVRVARREGTERASPGGIMGAFLGIIIPLVISAAAVVLAGVALARSGDVIAARTRLGRLWVGSIFLAIGTSLPELLTDLSAVRLGVPDLAAGDLFGSSMANMLILALVALPGRTALFRRAAHDHGLAAALAIMLTAMAAVFVIIRVPWDLFGIGVGSFLIAVTYLVGIRTIFRQSALMHRAGTTPEIAAGSVGAPDARELPTLRRAILSAVIASIVIIVAAPVFARSAEGVAALTGIGATFVGTALVGLATSLPELVTSLAAVRIGAYDLAVGNLFGSNAFNMILFVPLDLANRSGPTLAAVDPAHAVTALVTIVLMSMALAAVLYRAEGRARLGDPTAFLMLVFYAAGLFLVYLRSVLS